MKRNIYKLLSSAKQGLFALALIVFSGTAHSQATYTFNYTGAVQTLTLPAGNYQIECWGADGGDVTAGPGGGGKGGYSIGALSVVTAGTLLNIYVGSKGGSVNGTSGPSGSGGWNGGGGGGYCGKSAGGGGGAADVRLVGTAATDRIIVAGGGGGAAYYNQLAVGGNGGAQLGQNGDIITSGNVTTASGGGAGANGSSPGLSPIGFSNSNGTATGGGGGGNSPSGYGQAGTGGGAGGAGGSIANGSTGGSGGGGGGYAGGAGGTQTVNVGAGGGGGSGYIGGVTNGTTIASGQIGFVTNPVVTGSGRVIITELCGLSLTASGSNSLNPSICSGQSLTLTTNGISNYAWSTGNTTSPTIAVSPTTTTVYTLSATSPSNCTASRSMTVIVSSAAPVLTYSTVPSTGSVCLGQTVTLTAGGAVSYTLDSGTGTIINGQAFTPTATSNYTITGENGCGSHSVIATINVAPLPVTAVASSTLICSGSPATLTAGGATNYTWTASTATSLVNSYIISPTANTTYSLYGVTGPCSGNTVITISTKPLPTLNVSASSSVICNGNSTNLSVTGNALTYTWSPGNQNSTSIAVSPTTTTLYSVIGTNSVNCTSGTGQVIIVTPNPTISISVSNPTVCPGGSSTLTANGADSYTWSGSNGNSLVVNPASNSTYNVIGSYTATGCSGIDTAAVSVLNPVISISSSTAVCSGSQVAISASGADTYTWSNNAGSAGITVTPTLTTVYTVTGSVTDQNTFISCDVTNSVQVTVNANPIVTATADHSVICLNNSAVLTADGAGANGSYTWTGGSGAVHSSTNLVSPIANQSYSVTGVDDNGCKGTAGLFIQVSPCTGIASIAANSANLVIYPNPSNGEITINSDQNITLQITTETGQLVRTVTLNGTDSSVKVSNLASGIYFVTGHTMNGSVKQKLIIMK